MLGIYAYDEFEEQYVAYTLMPDENNPITIVNNPKEYSSIQDKLYIRNDAVDKYYTDVTLQWTPSLVVDSPLGIEYKILVQENQPTEAEWAAVTSGDLEEIGDVGTSTQASLDFTPFWIKIEIPRSIPQGVYEDIALSHSYEELPIV